MNTETIQNTLTDTRKCVHPACIVCSLKNTRGLRMEFEIDDDGGVKAMFSCDRSFEGYPGMVHGGVISSILDGAMGNCMFARGLATVTAEMTTRFRHPVAIGQEATISAKIIRYSHPLYILEAEIIQEGKVKATAKGKYYDQPKLIDTVDMIF